MRKALGLAVVVAMLLAPLAMPAQFASTAWAQTSDPPARVGRLNYMNGPVSYAPGGLNQWAQATLNYPLTTGTALWTDQNGRAELHIGSTAIRMDETTELDILNLDDQTTQLRVAQGTLDISLYQLDADERFEVATPSASVALVRPGHYRLEADDNGVRVIVWKGQVDVATSSYTFSIYSGQTALVSDASYQMVVTPAVDEFGRWSLGRHAEEERALQVTAPYVAPAMTGYEDLPRYGAWRTVGGYGHAWFPRVPSGWAPYRDGRWVWISPWGWTWVDSAPWGFAPFHYGRWVVIGGVWAWIPGPVVVRPVFAPALVVFIVIGEAIGWFPLAPHEVYVPPYFASPVYHRRVNINIININITNINITNVRYVYRHAPHAITIVRRGSFNQGGVVGGSLITVPRADLEHARVAAGAPMQPRVESMLGRPQGGVGSHRPPAVVEQRPVVVRHDPPAPIRPQVSAPGAQMRAVPVRRATERREPRAEPQPAPAQPVAPGPQAPRPNAPIPQPTTAAPQQNAPAPQPRPQIVQPAPEPNAVATPHRRRPNEPAPQAPQPNAPAQQPNAPVRQPNAPAPQPNAPAQQPGGVAPQPRPQIVQPAPEPNAVPTPHRRRPNEPAPQAPQPNAPAQQPNAPVRQPNAPAPQPRPQIVQPAPEPNPMPTPHPGGVAPQPRPQQPVVPPQPAPRQVQPEVPAPRQQPRVQVPQPVPTPQGNPMSPQIRPAPQPPRNQIRQPVCDERSPNHDPRLCPQNRSRRR